MIFSRALLGTDKEKTKLSWSEYILFSCIQQGWMNCWYSFQNWSDLVWNNYQNYALLADDDPLEQCILYFWDSLEDDVYPKEFLESLMQMVDDVDTGKVKTYPMEDVMLELKELIGEEE
jgi:hypothetical protein